MSNSFVSEANASKILKEIGIKKLTLTELMPNAAANVEDISYLYLGATDVNFTQGAVYTCKEVTPATDPKSYEWQYRIQFNMAVDNAFSTSSVNALQNKVITEKANSVDAEIADIINIYGSKNILQNNLISQTISGLTITVNDDKSITIDGTATADVELQLCGNFALSKGAYTLSGLDSDAPDNVRIRAYDAEQTSSGPWINKNHIKEEFELFAENAYSRAVIEITNGAIIDDYTFYPMISATSLEDSSYMPYVPTNMQLADSIAALETAFANINAITYGS